MFGILRGKGGRLKSSSTLLSPSEGFAPPSQDTLAAIAELSQVVKNNPDAIEIYLALGNLYRSRGEIDRAVQIRNNLIVRPGLNDEFKAKAYFELGLDYKRGGFMDRAQAAFEQARAIAGDDPAIVEEQARLAAENKDYEKAARTYSLLNKPIPQAHYLVRLARKIAASDAKSSRKWLNKALQIHPGSVEAHLEKIVRSFDAGDWDTLAAQFKQALESVETQLRFALPEGLIQHVAHCCKDTGSPERDGAVAPSTPIFPPECCTALLPVIEEQADDLLLYYYGAWMLIQAGDTERARILLEKTLLLNPDFWPARLELLDLNLKDQSLTPDFKGQLEFFLQKARRVKRFVCTKCGLKREQIFFVCPRCQSWHSISFRQALND